MKELEILKQGLDIAVSNGGFKSAQDIAAVYNALMRVASELNSARDVKMTQKNPVKNKKDETD